VEHSPKHFVWRALDESKRWTPELREAFAKLPGRATIK
jgi:hypothetical protein